jgi:hypothetical protein
MSQKVAIVLDLEDDRQSYHLEKYLRENMFPGKVISYANLPDTSKLYEEDETFRKYVKSVKTAQWNRDTYINENN